jgi:Eukaryotic aspartyl protease
VFSDKLSASSKKGHAVYKTSASKKLSGESWSISYGDGSGASGTVYADTVVIGTFSVEFASIAKRYRRRYCHFSGSRGSNLDFVCFCC